MPQVRYIGEKPRKTDNITNSGVTWHGYGDVQTVDTKTWQALSQHPEVWELVTEAAAPAPAAQTATPAPTPAPAPAQPTIEHKYVLAVDKPDGGSDTLVLDKLSRRDLDKLVTDHKLEIPEADKGELNAYRAAVYKAATGS